MDRVILHSDLNNFYASVEALSRPELRDRPFAVCGDEEMRHGIVLAKNYIAKRYGIKTGESLGEAREKCRDLITVKANFELYLYYSKMVRAIYRRYTDRIEPFGIDECWLDVSGCQKDGKEIADEIREAVKTELGLTVSVGVSWNKVFAKLASDMKKPDATTIINKANYKEKVFPLTVNELLYVGRATYSKFKKYNINTIGELAATDKDFLKRLLGKWGESLYTYANGLDASPVVKSDEAEDVKSVGNSLTAARDLVDETDVRRLVTALSESVAERLREQGLQGSVVTLWIRDKNLMQWAKQIKLERPTFLSGEMIETAMALYKKYYTLDPAIRTLGVTLSSLSPIGAPEQLSLLDDGRRFKEERMEYTIDSIRKRFGKTSLQRGLLCTDRFEAINPGQTHNITSFIKK